MDLETVKRNWDEFGRRDPLWAILTAPQKRNGGWDRSEFFRTGQLEMADLMRRIESLPIKLARKRALDFGCGVGRVTQALAFYFDECVGVDIAPSMLKLAKRFNKLGSKCKYVLNQSPNLGLFAAGAFDFVYSNIVLQHIKPEFSLAYIREFIRILAPGGLVVFQLTSEPASLPRTSPGRTACAGALPADAFKACVKLAAVPARLVAGQPAVVRVRVQNTGNAAWPCLGNHKHLFQIRMGNHWLDKDEGLLVNDDGRADLGADLPPGSDAEFTLTVIPPGRPGRYFLELDMLQEGVSWFGQKGSPTLRVAVDVIDRRRPLVHRLFSRALRASAPPDMPAPVMEMYGVKKELVLDAIERNGGRVICVEENQAAGEQWISFEYYVTKVVEAP